jgi:uncharacterized protein YnzC (UPF0291/DUF896 family)
MLGFFELAKTSSGFRLTQAEIQRQNEAQSWMNSMQGKFYHQLHGTWFSDEQREQIVSTMNDMYKEKMSAIQQHSPKGTTTEGTGTPESKPAGKVNTDLVNKHGG